MSKITIEALVKRSNDVQNNVRSMVESISKEEATIKPSDSEWSIAQVITHLNLTFDHYFPKIKKAMEKAQPGQVDSYRRSFLIGLFSEGQKPKKGKRKMKSKTFKFLIPEQSNIDQVLHDFEANQEMFCEIIKEGRTHDISRILVNSAIGPLLKFTLPECYDFLLSHEERHLQQIRDIIGQLRAVDELAAS